MQLFSRKKALLTASLAALGGLAGCGDNVTVPVAPPASVVISITPSNASLNIGDVATFSVQVTGGSTTTPPTLTTCTSSNVAVATAAATPTANGGTCRVTAIAAGNATITAAATGGQQASAAVTVSAQTGAISNLTLSPNNANLAPGQTVTITPNVTRGATANTVNYTYVSSNPAIATVATPTTNGSVVVTAVAPGVATITATAVGSGTGFSTATLTAAATITVGNAPSGITTLTVTPTSLNLAVGRTAGITISVTQPAGAPATTYTCVSSNAAIVVVSCPAPVNGVVNAIVTAIGPGTANITVTANSAASANGQFAASTMTQVVAVTVSAVANVSIQAINQGPYRTTGLDSAYLTTTPPAPIFGTGPKGPDGGVIAGIRRDLNPQVGQPIDVTNTKDQIQVILNLQANGQRIDSVVVFVDSGATGTSTVRRAAARQIFTNGDAGNQQTVSIETFILTDDFTTNEATGIGEVAFVNGLKRISASAFTTLPTGSPASACPLPIGTGGTCELQNAANVRQNVNFNNIDGFALRHVQPANNALDVASRTWWGGPTVSSVGQPSGVGTFQIYPVMYTQGRIIRQVSATFGRCLGFTSLTGVGFPAFVTDSAAPFLFQYGKTAPTNPPASSTFIGCNGVVGAYDFSDQFRFEDFPMVVGSLDNSNNPGPRTIYAYNPQLGTEPFAGPRPTLFRTSPQLVAANAIRVDYQDPVLTLAVTQSNGERFVNDAYNLSTNYTATDYPQFPNVGVGLPPVRNTQFFVAAVGCGTTTFTLLPGGLIGNNFSIPAGVNTPQGRESPCDFTNNAFIAQATETDRLGNRGTIGNAGAPGTAGVISFGIDNTAPELAVSWDGSGPIPDTPNHYRATGDSIFQPTNPANGTPATPIAIAPAANPTDFLFGARYRDERSGFNIDSAGFRTVKRFAPSASATQSNRATVTTVATRRISFTGNNGNPVENEDPTFRRDSVTIYGAGPLANNVVGGTPLQASPAVGYYLYELTLIDRAGNRSTLTERAVIDRTSPVVTGTTIPPVFGASGTAAATIQAFGPTGTDDLEAVDFDLFLRYPAMAMVGDSSNGSTTIIDGARVRFRRNYFADIHSPWAVFSDTLLASVFGPGQAIGGTAVSLPIATIRGIEPVDSTDAPIAYGTGATNPFVGFKPDRVGVYVFDVRATHRGTTFLPPYDTNRPFRDLGMTNLFPTLAPSGGEAGYNENLFPGNVTNGTRWDTKDLNPVTPGLDRLVGWAGFGGTGATIEFRATTSTVVTQPPFPTVHLFKWEVDAQHTGSGTTSPSTALNDSASGQWVYVASIGQSAPSNPIINDQGSTRFWRYQFTASAFPAVTNGSIIQPGVTVGCYRAVGVDLSGDGITTRSFGTGCPATVGTFASNVTVVNGPVNMTLTLRGYGNGTGTITATTGAPFSLTKSNVNGVERVSQNRPNAGENFLITPTLGTTIDRAPLGCTVVGNVTFPTANAFNCTYTLNAPATITVIFENVNAGGTGSF